jgi:hypothetical protein
LEFETNVIVELNVRFPFMTSAAAVKAPLYPVQSKLFIYVVPLIVNAPDPAVMLALITLAPAAVPPMETVREFAPEYVKFTVGMARNVAVEPPVQREDAPLELRLISNVDGSKEPVYPDHTHRWIVTVAPRVTVPVPEFASNKATSAAPGADAPEAPPVVVDQLAVLVVSHVPEPPTQYLFAILISFRPSG